MTAIPTQDEEILKCICQTLFDKKGFNILSLDVRAISTMTEYCIIAEGNVEKHVQALSRAMQETLSEQKIKPLHVEGQKEGDWVVLDFSRIMVHLFIPEMREKYALEELWQSAKVINVPIKITSISTLAES
jgi:ribosome-associated protein